MKDSRRARAHLMLAALVRLLGPDRIKLEECEPIKDLFVIHERRVVYLDRRRRRSR